MQAFCPHYIFISLIVIIFIQEIIISKFTCSLNKKIFSMVDDLKSITEAEHLKIEDLKLVRKRLRYITKIISYFETVFIMVVSLLFFKNKGLVEAVMPILTVVAGWMAIKIIGNYSQWSDYTIGRASYYVFLIGSFLNIFIAILCGFLLSFLI